MMSDPILELVATLHKLGRPVAQIARRVNKPVGWVNKALNEHEFQLRVAQFEEDVVDDGTELWNEDSTNYAVERLTPVAFRTLEGIMRDEKASASSRVKASELLLKYQPKLKEVEKIDEERITHIQFRPEDVLLLERLQREKNE